MQEVRNEGRICSHRYEERITRCMNMLSMETQLVKLSKFKSKTGWQLLEIAYILIETLSVSILAKTHSVFMSQWKH